MNFIKNMFCKKNKPCNDVHAFSINDMRDAFDAGDRFRLYLDKNAIGLGYPYDEDIPSNDVIINTMSFDAWMHDNLNKKY